MGGQAVVTAYLCFWLAVFGAVLGSFLDCAVSRWAAGDPHPFGGRSRCDSCGHVLGAADLVPVLSFLLRRGRCRYCGGRIPPGCLWAELAGAALLVCVGLRFGPTARLGQWLVWAALLLALSLTDLSRRLIPDRLLLLLAGNRALWFFLLERDAALVWESLLACLVPAALLALVLGMEKGLGREVMGGGDVKLLFTLALYLDWAELLLTLLAGCLLGLVWAGLAGGRRGTAIPFGPFLAGGALLTVCCGAPVLDWYFSLL